MKAKNSLHALKFLQNLSRQGGSLFFKTTLAGYFFLFPFLIASERALLAHRPFAKHTKVTIIAKFLIVATLKWIIWVDNLTQKP